MPKNNLTQEEWKQIFGILAGGAATYQRFPHLLTQDGFENIDGVHKLVYKLSEFAQEIQPIKKS